MAQRNIPQTAGKGLSNISASLSGTPGALVQFSTTREGAVEEVPNAEVAPTTYVTEPITYAPLTLGLSATPVELSDDELSLQIALPFSFTFYDETYDWFIISSNGFITFVDEGNSGCCNGTVLPSEDAPSAMIAGYWTDLSPTGDSTSTIFYEVQGESPDRVMLIDFVDRPYNSDSSKTVNFQIHLYEAGNIIEIHTNFSDTDYDHLATQGIHDFNQEKASYLSGRLATYLRLNEDGVRFTPQNGIESPLFQDHEPVATGLYREEVHVLPTALSRSYDQYVPLIIAKESEIINPLFVSFELVYNGRAYQGYHPDTQFFLSWGDSGDTTVYFPNSLTVDLLNATSNIYIPAASLFWVLNDSPDYTEVPTEDLVGQHLYFGMTNSNAIIGTITELSIFFGGTDYYPSQIVQITDGTETALIGILAVDGGGAVTSFTILDGGDGFDTENNPHTTESDGNINALVVNAGGTGYTATDTGNVDTGNGDATFTVSSIQGPTYPIIAVDQGDKTFTIAGDHTGALPDAGTFFVGTSTGNNGTYTVVHATLDSLDETVIEVVEAIGSPAVDGYVDVTGGVAVTLTKTNSGTGYSTATGVATVNPSGLGTGLTVDITSGIGLGFSITEVEGGTSQLYLTITYEKHEPRSEV